MTFRAPNPHKSSKKIIQTKNHAKPLQITKKTSNVTEIKHKSHKKSKKKTRIIKNQNPPLNLILSKIQRSPQKLRHGKIARNNPLPSSDVGLRHPSFLGLSVDKEIQLSMGDKTLIRL
jgi:hypothetical protein